MRMLWSVGIIAAVVALSAVVLVVRARADRVDVAPWKRALMEGTYIRLPRDSSAGAKAAPAPVRTEAPAVESFHIPPPPAELPPLPPPAVVDTAAEEELRK